LLIKVIGWGFEELRGGTKLFWLSREIDRIADLKE
jgi:hypothetical protein